MRILRIANKRQLIRRAAAVREVLKGIRVNADSKSTSISHEPMSSKQDITHRYIFALALVAMVLIGSYATLMNRMHQNEDDALIINRAGQQRMLSQRIALLMHETLAAPSVSDSDIYAAKLDTALTRMTENHRWLYAGLSEDAPSEHLVALYEREDGVSQSMRAFLSRGKEFLTGYRSDDVNLEALLEISDIVAAVARNGFLQELDEIVQEHQRLSEADVARFEILETLFVCAGLLLLAFEALLIFRPMASAVEDNIARLNKSNKELREFSFRVSHDLRAPIASSLGMIAIADEARAQDNDEELEFSLSRIRSSMEKLDQTIENIVSITRAGAGDAALENVSVQTMVNSIVEQLSAMKGYEKIQLHVDVQLPETIVTKRVFLQQILENLMSNAIKYADLTHRQPEIRISARCIGNSYEICVTDNGIGIAPEYRDQLFGMFKRFHPNVAFGSGLGLYLVRQNAIALGGDIDYQPQEPGSQFTLTLAS